MAANPSPPPSGRHDPAEMAFDYPPADDRPSTTTEASPSNETFRKFLIAWLIIVAIIIAAVIVLS